MILTTDHHYLATGLDIVPGGSDGDELRMWLMKLNNYGDTLWLRIFDSPTEEDEDANDAVETPAKNGYYLHGDVGQDFKYFFKRIIRTDTAGRLIWQKDVKNGEKYMARGNLEVLASGDKMAMAYVSGKSAVSLWDWVTLLDTAANVLWSKKLLKASLYGGQPIVRALPSGNLLVALPCDTLIPNQYTPTTYFYEINVHGDVVREGHLDASDGRYDVYNMRIASDGQLLLAGVSLDYVAGDDYNWVAKVDAFTYQPIWQRYYLAEQSIGQVGGFWDIVETPWGGLAALGYMELPMSGGVGYNADAWLMTLDHEGCFFPDCGDTTIVLNALDLKPAHSRAHFEVFPNPAFDYLYIHRPVEDLNSTTEITLFDLAGVVYLKTRLDKGQLRMRIDAGGLPTGLYFASFAKAGAVVQIEKVAVHRP